MNHFAYSAFIFFRYTRMYTSENICRCNGWLAWTAAIPLLIGSWICSDPVASVLAATLAGTSIYYHLASAHCTRARIVDIIVCLALYARCVWWSVYHRDVMRCIVCMSLVWIQCHPRHHTCAGGPIHPRFQLTTQIITATSLALT